MLKFVAFFIATVLRLFAPCKVHGKENLQKHSTVYMCNHQSIVDIVILMAHLPMDTYFMAKKEAFKNKMLGWILKMFKAFPVDRQSVDLKSIKFACSILNNGSNLMIFPQGTRKDSPKVNLEDMHAGMGMIALKTNATVVPMMFTQKPKFFKKNVLYIGKPMDLSGFEGKKPNSAVLKEFSTQSAEAMNSLLGEQ